MCSTLLVHTLQAGARAAPLRGLARPEPRSESSRTRGSTTNLERVLQAMPEVLADSSASLPHSRHHILDAPVTTGAVTS